MQFPFDLVMHLLVSDHWERDSNSSAIQALATYNKIRISDIKHRIIVVILYIYRLKFEVKLVSSFEAVI